ncbi:MAG: TIGR02584 family CRISPR-associated protein [Deltaproteobacteria bacterium]|nr:TIGR02584 family CRISPR-associated protein [Deltaproteobacteria bacterium]
MNTVLVAVAGLTPQVITETLYAMYRQGVVPSEVHVLTTLPGRQKIREFLLDPHRGAFYTFCSEYGIDHRRVRFDGSTVHVLLGPEGLPVEDLRTLPENGAVADQIVGFVRDLCERPDVSVHASLAGGRKTLSFYLGYALSLFGRPHDRLSHVLVAEDFETHREFFYPPREPRDLKTSAEKWINTADARVDLVDIPFLRLRDLLPSRSLDGGFAEVIRRAQEGLGAGGAAGAVTLILGENRIVCGSFACALRDQPFAVYAHLVLSAAAGRGLMPFQDLTGEPFLEEIWEEQRLARGLSSSPAFNRLPELVDLLARSPRGDRNFAAVVTKINRAIEEAFPDVLSGKLRVRRSGKGPVAYGVRLREEEVVLQIRS